MKKILVVKKGGAGSGHHGHSGRPGLVGGSAPDKGGGGLGGSGSSTGSRPAVGGSTATTQEGVVEEDFQRAVADASTYDELPEKAQKTISKYQGDVGEGLQSRGYTEITEGYGKGEPAAPGGIPREFVLEDEEGMGRNIYVRETDFGHVIELRRGDKAVARDYLHYDFSPEAQAGGISGKVNTTEYISGIVFGDVEYFLMTGDASDFPAVEEKEFKCSDSKKKPKKKFADKIIGSSMKKDEEDEDEE